MAETGLAMRFARVRQAGRRPGKSRHSAGVQASGAAPLSILFLRHARDANFADGTLVTEHGSWNRSQKIGYKVVALHWRNGEITEEPFLSRFLKDGRVFGRPVDNIEDSDRTIFISDDYNGIGAIWRVA
jgi:glucose/arabinose dehydrogenase